MRKSVAVVVALCVLLITPYFVTRVVFGYEFGEREMRAAVEGTWQVEVAGGERITIEIKQAGQRGTEQSALPRGWVRTAEACGHRSLIRSAEACMDTTEMPLEVAVIDGPAGAADGRFEVNGTEFEQGQLELAIGSHRIFAQISPSGQVTEVTGDARLLTRVR